VTRQRSTHVTMSLTTRFDTAGLPKNRSRRMLVHGVYDNNTKSATGMPCLARKFCAVQDSSAVISQCEHAYHLSHWVSWVVRPTFAG
jgi:hypothetical protein